MSALTVISSAVFASDSAERLIGVAHGEILAGQSVYQRADFLWALAKASNALSGAGVLQQRGIALNHGRAGQPIIIAVSDPDFQPGATLVTGESYYIGEFGGEIMPSGDLAASDYRILLGIAKSTTVLVLEPFTSGATT